MTIFDSNPEYKDLIADILYPCLKITRDRTSENDFSSFPDSSVPLFRYVLIVSRGYTEAVLKAAETDPARAAEKSVVINTGRVTF